MGETVWIQCTKCGSLHQVPNKYASISENDLYTKPLWCNRCRDECKHLLIGENKEDFYLFGDNTLDNRFYQYNTK